MSKRILLQGVTVCLLLWFSTLLHARETLHLPLDGSIAAENSTVDIAHSGLQRFRNGHAGGALRVGGVYGNLRVPVGDLFTAQEGSVSMWVAPVNWQSGDSDFHVFFDARGDGALVLYKYFEGSRLLFLATRDIDGDGNVVVGRDIDWQPGRWIHLVATWSYQGIRFYIDGQPVAALPTAAELPATLADEFELGDLGWGRVRTSSSLLDDVRIFNHALTTTQVARLHAGLTADAMYTDFDENALSISHDATTVSALLITTEWSNNVASHPVSFVAEAVCADASASSRVTGTAASTLRQVSIPLPGCATPGRLQVSIRASDDRGGQLVKTMDVDVVLPGSLDLTPQSIRPVAPLLGSGNSSATTAPANVPQPWSLPFRREQQVSVWGRRYDFSHGVLAASIRSQERMVVPRPIALLSGDQTLVSSAANAAPAFSGNSEGEVLLSTEALGDGRTRFLLSGAVAYDGVYKVSVRVNRAMTLREDLRLQIPLSSDILRRWHRYSGRSLENTGALSARQGRLLAMPYTPYLWVGNEQVGIMWYAESDRYWPNAANDTAIELVRTGEEEMLVIDLASAGIVLDSHWHFDFGLLPTPVRPPMQGKGSRLRLSPLPHADIDVVWPDSSERSFRFYGYPEARNRRYFNADLRRREQGGTFAAPYLCPTFISTAAPEWRTFSREWSMKRFDSTSADVMASGGALAMVSPRASSWQNFFAGKFDAFLQDYHPRALYFDNAQLYGASAPEAGVGYETAQGLRPEYPLLGYRQLFRNIALASDRAGWPTRILHVSGQLNPMITAYGHYYLNGEQYRGVVQGSYLDILPLEEFRQQFSVNLSGAAPLFIPEFDQTRQAQIQPTRELMGLLFVHDIPLWPVWVNTDVVQHAIDALTREVPAASHFVRYDSPAVPATSSQLSVLVSAHQTDNAPPLLIAFNTGSGVASDLCFTAAASTNASFLEDRVTGERFGRTREGCYRVSFPARNYRLLKPLVTAAMSTGSPRD